jgi:hypothetical protein
LAGYLIGLKGCLARWSKSGGPKRGHGRLPLSVVMHDDANTNYGDDQGGEGEGDRERFHGRFQFLWLLWSFLLLGVTCRGSVA